MARQSWGNKTLMITGGTGSFGRAFVSYLLKLRKPPVIRIFSRDEFKQHQMQQELIRKEKYLRFLLGDVRDKTRLRRAMNGVDVVIHAAALKQIPLGEYNPIEPILTNITGSRNIIEASLDAGVKRAILISSDKAAYPVNLYGATKLCAEKLFVQGNVYAGKRRGVFSVVRYGNVLGSRGSVVPLFLKQKHTNKLTLTHPEMTRFWITLPKACEFVAQCSNSMRGGEIFVPKLPSVKIIDLAKVVAPRAKISKQGMRPGEKLHEVLITEEESRRVNEYKDHYVIQPQFPFWEDKWIRRGRPRKPFLYRSDNNTVWLKQRELKELISNL